MKRKETKCRIYEKETFLKDCQEIKVGFHFWKYYSNQGQETCDIRNSIFEVQGARRHEMGLKKTFRQGDSTSYTIVQQEKKGPAYRKYDIKNL